MENGKVVVSRSKEEKQQRAMQQPTNNWAGNGKGSKGEAIGGRSKENKQWCAMQQPTINEVGISKGSKEEVHRCKEEEEQA